MLDSAQSSLFQEIVDDAPLGIFIDLDRVLVDIVQQIEIEVVRTQLLQLALKDILRVILFNDHMTGIFGGQVIAVPGILLQDPSHDHFGTVVHVRPRSVDVVDTVGKCVVGHFSNELFIDCAVLLQWKAHGAEAEHGEGQSLEVTVDHRFSFLLLFRYSISIPTAFARWE